MRVFVITVIHRANAETEERFDKFKNFVHWLESLGIDNGRLNPVGIPAGAQDTGGYALSIERLIYVYKELTKFVLENGYRWRPFTDIWSSLQGKFEVPCIFRPCDPYHTHSAVVILGNGTLTNCLRQKIHLRHPQQIFRKEELLQKVPIEYGGCKGCRFFRFCNGGCSANGMNGDWRNRDVNCPAYKTVFEFSEKAMKAQGMSIKTQNSNV